MNWFKRVHASHIELEFGSVSFLRRGENGKTEEKPLGTKIEPTTNSTRIWLRRRGFEPGPHWWEANAPTTTQPLLPKLFREPFLSYHPASCCFNHYCYCFIFEKLVGDSAEERLHRSAQRLRVRNSDCRS